MRGKDAVVNPVAEYLALIDEAYDRKAWHGTTLRGSLRGLSQEQAAWRPAEGRHNIWEIVVHAAYWKYAVARRLAGGHRGGFLYKGSNWFTRPDPVSGPRAWADDVEVLDRYHRELRAVVAALEPADLSNRPEGSQQSRAYILRGIAAHDLYHAGQIQLLKRLPKH
ncbi:MAG: DinB family protein [Vicinamibacterales bacterium]